MGPAMEGLLSGLEQKILELLVHLEAAQWVLCLGVTVRRGGEAPDPRPQPRLTAHRFLQLAFSRWGWVSH